MRPHLRGAGRPVSLLGLLVLLSLDPPEGQATAPDAVQVSERVRAVLSTHLGNLDETIRQRYANDLIAALGTASSAQSSRILANLDQAIGYHATRIEVMQQRYQQVGVPEGLVREGYDLEFQYLTQRVLRAARNEWTSEGRTEATAQIESLAQSLQTSLEERVAGEAGKQYVDQEVGKLRQAWIGSLDLPLNRFVDGPISPERLEAIKTSISAGMADFASVELTATDVSSRERLAELGVLKLVADARKTCYRMTQDCFTEFKSPEGRCNDWQARVDAQLGARRKEAIREEWEKSRREGRAKPGPGKSRLASPASAAPAVPEANLPPAPALPKIAPDDHLSPGLSRALILSAFAVGALLLGTLAARWLKSR